MRASKYWHQWDRDYAVWALGVVRCILFCNACYKVSFPLFFFVCKCRVSTSPVSTIRSSEVTRAHYTRQVSGKPNNWRQREDSMCPTLPSSSARSLSHDPRFSRVAFIRSPSIVRGKVIRSLSNLRRRGFHQRTSSAPNRDAATRAWNTLWERARLPAAVSTPPHWMTHPPITNLQKDYVTLVLLTPTIRQHRSAGFFRVSFL